MAQEIVGIKIQLDGQDAAKQAGTSIGSIRKEIKEANSELIAAQRNFGEYSAEAIAAARRVAQLRDSIQEARETADLFDPGKKFQAFSGAINAVAGGFSAVQGALGLVGVESEQVEKQLLKVQSALALSQGLSTITDSAKDFQRLAAVIRTSVVTAFSTLRGAIAATGIGALVVGLGLLVANFDAVVAAIRRAIPGFDSFVGGIRRAINAVTDFIGITSEAERQVDRLGEVTKERNEEIERSIKVLSAQGNKETEIFNLRKEQIGNEIRLLNEKEKVDKSLSEADSKRRKDLIADAQALDAGETARLAKQAQDRNKAASDAAKQRAEALRQEKERELEIEREYQAKLDAQEKTAVDARRKLIEDSAKILQDAQQEAFLNTLQGRDRELAELDIKFQEELERFGSNLTARNAIEEAFAIQREEINKRFDKEDQDRKVASTAATIEQIKLEQKARQDAAKAAVELEQQKSKAITESFGEIGNALGALSNLIGRNTAQGKVLAIAQAVVNTFVGITEVLSRKSTIPEPFGTIAKVASVATISATGFAAVRNIQKTPIPGFASSGGSVPGDVRGAAPIAPALPLTQTVTQLQSGTINQLQSATTRAYVVESDVTGAQERIRRINRAARLG